MANANASKKTVAGERTFALNLSRDQLEYLSALLYATLNIAGRDNELHNNLYSAVDTTLSYNSSYPNNVRFSAYSADCSGNGRIENKGKSFSRVVLPIEVKTAPAVVTVQKVTLEMSERDAQVLVALTGAVSSDNLVASDVSEALRKAGIDAGPFSVPAAARINEKKGGGAKIIGGFGPSY